jgi:methylthioribose-1-phosphate isomerase
MLPTIDWQDDGIVMIDQRKLPSAEVWVRCRTATEVAKAIKTMVIRGAPAIGVAAAMGIALGARRSKATGTRAFTTEFQRNCDLLAATRPTAVNLFWAIERMKQTFAGIAHGSRRRPARSTTRMSRAAARWGGSARRLCPTARAS